METLSPVSSRISLLELRGQLSTFRKLYTQLEGCTSGYGNVQALRANLQESMRYGIMFWEGDIANYHRSQAELQSIKKADEWKARRQLAVLLIKLCEGQNKEVHAQLDSFLTTAKSVEEVISFIEQDYLELCTMLSAYYQGVVAKVGEES